MTDISKCDGTNCDKKDTCYRYLAPDNPYYQSYLLAEDAVDKEGCCKYYIASKRTSD